MRRLIEVLAVGVTDSAGAVVTSGTVDFYLAGTTTRKTVYSDHDLDSPLSNPSTLDAAGRLIAYSDVALSLVISTSGGTLVRRLEYVGTADADIGTASLSAVSGVALDLNDVSGLLDVQVDGATISVNSSNQLKVPDNGIGQAHIADDIALAGNCSTTGTFTVGDAAGDALRIGGSAGPTATFVSSSPTLDRVQLSTAIQPGATAGILKPDTGGRTLSVADSTSGTARAIVTSPMPSSHGLMIVRGHVNGTTAAIIAGEGFTVARNGTGDYTVTFSTAFADAPVVIPGVNGAFIVADVIGTPSTTVANIKCYLTSSNTITDINFSFIAVGQRGA